MSGYLSRLKGLLRDRNLILSLALTLGILLGQGAQWTEKLVLPALRARRVESRSLAQPAVIPDFGSGDHAYNHLPAQIPD